MAAKRIDTKSVADRLRERYEPLRAVTLIGRKMLPALFAGRSNDVAFWALVHAQFCQQVLPADLQDELVPRDNQGETQRQSG